MRISLLEHLAAQVIRVFEDSCGDEWLGQIECCVESGDGAYRCVCVRVASARCVPGNKAMCVFVLMFLVSTNLLYSHTHTHTHTH